MSNSIFRQKSLDRISSPEQFDEYVKISSPGVWTFIAAVIALLIGVFVWSVFGRLDTTINVAVVSDASGTYCFIPEDDLSLVKSGMTVMSNDKSFVISEIEMTAEQVDEKEAPVLLHSLGYDDSTWVNRAELTGDIEYGIYSGTIIVESVRPISFVTN